MRLQLENDLPFDQEDVDGPQEGLDDDKTDDEKPTKDKGTDSDSSDEAQEEAFLAIHRQMQRQASAPGSGRQSNQNSSGYDSKGRRNSDTILKP